MTYKTANTQTKPKRIQRKRSKGWRMPPNTVYVGRPTKWGNPYTVGFDGDHADCVALYRKHLWKDSAGNWRIDANPLEKLDVRELRGKDLVCWCPAYQPCHADVLLEIANAKDSL